MSRHQTLAVLAAPCIAVSSQREQTPFRLVNIRSKLFFAMHEVAIYRLDASYALDHQHVLRWRYNLVFRSCELFFTPSVDSSTGTVQALPEAAHGAPCN